jgi:hypothetical protein
MRNRPILFILLSFVLITASCKKDKNSTAECFPGATTIRQIVNQPATIKQSNLQFYIVEKGSIDLKLIPCDLPVQFQVDNLAVTISGEVKAAAQQSVCCTENFIIQKISR